MEKNRIRPKKFGNNVRMSYSRQKEVLEMPNLNRSSEEFISVVFGRRSQ